MMSSTSAATVPSLPGWTKRQRPYSKPKASRSWLTVATSTRSEEHTSELQSLMRISYAVFCLKKKNQSPHIIKLPYNITHNSKQCHKHHQPHTHLNDNTYTL